MIAEHPAPLTYDLRTRAGIGIRDLGTTWPWDESVWFVQELVNDPDAHTTAALLGWSHPASRIWLTLADLFDVTARDKKGRPAKTARPWQKEPIERAVRRGRTDLSPADAIAALARAAGREIPSGW